MNKKPHNDMLGKNNNNKHPATMRRRRKRTRRRRKRRQFSAVSSAFLEYDFQAV